MLINTSLVSFFYRTFDPLYPFCHPSQIFPSSNHQSVFYIYAFLLLLFVLGTKTTFHAHSELHVSLGSLWFLDIIVVSLSFQNTKTICRALACLSGLYFNQINPFGNTLEAMFFPPHYSHINTSASGTALPVPLLSQSISLPIKFTTMQLWNLVLAPVLLSNSLKSSQLKNQTDNQAGIITGVRNDWRTLCNAENCPVGSGPRCEMSLCSTR